ncbi:MerR family transcriptional regulator [Cellvibrio sp. ARAG 10.3]|uniref:MerR family transcriptional regulator n=1 Tax=Cellvibrio sp. ARAG 10.3 TaxID=3451358 RepID=UPI003F46AD43
MNMQEPDTSVLLPIREISRLTGVNTVTLRAWERRYGLLKPTRTEKGHRLYSHDDVQRVKIIQSWLVRGLAISKVKGILNSETVDDIEAGIDSVWLEYSARIETALSQLNRAALAGLLNELVALYPAEIVADQLLAPVLEKLQIAAEYGARTKLAFLHSLVLEHFYFGHYRQRQTAKGKRVLVVNLNADDSDILPLILNYSLLVNTFQAEYIGYLPLPELVFAVEQTGAEGVVLYSDSAIHLGNLRQQLLEWQQILMIPVFVAGKITRMFIEERDAIQHLMAGDNLQAALATLTQTFTEQ